MPALNQPLIRLKRTTLFVNYTLATLRSNTEGAFAIPPSGGVDTRSGARQQRRPSPVQHRLQQPDRQNLAVSMNVNVQRRAVQHPDRARRQRRSVFNDRPAGVGRNTERAATQWNFSPQIAYFIPIGKQTPLGPPVTTVIAGGGVPSVQTFQQPPRYVFQIFVNAQNLTNHANYSGYSGTLTSPFFGQPTSVGNTRKIDFGINMNF